MSNFEKNKDFSLQELQDPLYSLSYDSQNVFLLYFSKKQMNFFNISRFLMPQK